MKKQARGTVTQHKDNKIYRSLSIEKSHLPWYDMLPLRRRMEQSGAVQMDGCAMPVRRFPDGLHGGQVDAVAAGEVMGVL